VNESAVLSRRIDAVHIPAEGTEIRVAASDADRQALAGAYDLLAVRSLEANATLVPAEQGAVEVGGRVLADIVQSCVVSLEPVEQHIDEPFELRFVPRGSPELAAYAAPHAELAIDPVASDPPEEMDGTTIDLGALIEEIFVLAIDPYPRAPEAVMPASNATGEPDPESPFAILRQRKNTEG
jgi:hypothetical protein